MKKNERIATFVKTLGGGTPGAAGAPRGGHRSVDAGSGDPAVDAGAGLQNDEHYLGYFTCFNEGRYYEAHDVLEHLWLQGCGEEHAFFKGLIQIAGAYVHLQKQFLRPEHPKDGKRLRPAVRLFALGEKNVAPYGPRHLGLDVAGLCAVCRKTAGEIEASEFTRNPWHPERAPQLHLIGEL